jgi:hypothetical protein
MDLDKDIVVLFEAPKIIAPEFRLYYNDKGEVLSYTCDKPEGTYVVIDKTTYAEMRHDIRIINGQISRVKPNAVVYKLMPNDNDGITCYDEDISLILDNVDDVNTQKWKLVSYELG